MSSKLERNEAGDASWTRWIPAGVLAVSLFLLGGYWIALYYLFDRTIVLDVQTGALEVTLASEERGKAFLDAWICERREPGHAFEVIEPPRPLGCPSRTHFLRHTPGSIETPVFPADAKLEITFVPGMLRIWVTKIPSDYKNTDIGRLEGGGVILLGDALQSFGTFPLNGEVKLGALFSETERLSTISGRYQIRGYSPSYPIDGDLRVLREGDLLAGAQLRFVSKDGENGKGHVVVMLPEPNNQLLRVTAISEHGQDNLSIQYYFTDETIIRPSIVEVLIRDHLVQLLLALFGAIASYGWLGKLVSRRSK